MKATDDPRLDVMFVPERPLLRMEMDVLAGECSFVRHGRIVRPVIPQIVGVSNPPAWADPAG